MNSQTLGFLFGAVGFGALIGAIYLASRKTVLGLGRWIAIAAGIFSLGLLFFSFSRNVYLSVGLMLFTGFGMMMQMASTNTLLQTLVDDDKRGRVMSLYVMAFMGTAPFGSFMAGSLGKYYRCTLYSIVERNYLSRRSFAILQEFTVSQKAYKTNLYSERNSAGSFERIAVNNSLKNAAELSFRKILVRKNFFDKLKLIVC